MWTVARLEDIGPRQAAHLAVGFFDGVHRGHQAVLRTAAERARVEGVAALVVTSWPRPDMVGHPNLAPGLLTTRSERLDRMRLIDRLDGVLDLDLAPSIVDLAPEEYLARLLRQIDVRGIVTGPRASLPLARQVDLKWLRRAGAEAGFLVDMVELMSGGEPISAERIRKLISDGDVVAAGQLLGASYRLSGLVVEGNKRGRQLGVPTANLRLDPVKLVPARGIYAVWARLEGESDSARPAVASIGVRPTFGQHNSLLVEIHLLDVRLDLYDQVLDAEFVARLREERKYDRVDDLVAQMHRDVDQARILLSSRGKPRA